VATGAPGQVLRVARAPIVATDDAVDVQLGVARPDGPADDAVPSRAFYGVAYELWRPVTTFAGAAGDDRVYLLDRASGTVTFAPVLDLRDTADAQPRALAALPPAGAQVRVWYRTGGGPAGNVAANTLTAMRDPIRGVRVTNPSPARGGRPIENLTAALDRFRYELSTQRRAITARDFEILALTGSEGVGRAGAFAGEHDQVQVFLAPYVGPQDRPGWRLPVEVLTEHQAAGVLEATQQLLDLRRPLSTGVVTRWTSYKPVSVRGRVVVPAHEDPQTVRAHLHERLFQLVSPLPAAGRNDGWPFGQPLTAADVRRVVEQCAPDKSRVDAVRLVIRDAPDTRIRAVGAGASEPEVWFAGGGEVLFRSANGGSGWEPAGRFPGEEVRRVIPAPASRPGALTVVTHTADGTSRVYSSADSGEHWTGPAELPALVNGAARVDRDGDAVLLLATDTGLYDLSAEPGSVPLQVIVDPADADLGFGAVASFGAAGVAVAAQAGRGVYLSQAAGRSGTFTGIGLSGADVRTLAVQVTGAATVLWAGLGEADPRKPGKGCQRAGSSRPSCAGSS
jgi:hypothetical protein